MVTIIDIIKGIDDYTEAAGHPPPRIAVTPDQMDAINSDPEAKRFVSRNDDGLTTVGGVVVDVWGRPQRHMAG